MLVRLNRFLARAGVASRRDADRIIAEGRVRLNGRAVTELGTKVDDSRDRVEVDGRIVERAAEPIYILLNKPKGVLVTMDDPFGRMTVRDLIPDLPAGVVPVGRLDRDSEGLLLLCNDGELAFRLTHPRYEVQKNYLVRVDGELNPEEVRRLEKGIPLDGKKTAPARARILERGSRKNLLQVDIHEGRKREVRRMFEVLGHRVLMLRRIGFAALSLKNLPSGAWRHLRPSEVSSLKARVGLE